MDPEDRPTNFIPRKCDSLRKMEAYDKIINERFERCLDLYLSARLRKKKLNMNPEALIPNLPKPQELRPFPTTQNIIFNGHQSRVRSIAVYHTGQYLASCDESGLILIFDVITSRIVRRIQLEGINYSLDWSNDKDGGLLAVCNENSVYLINPEFLPKKYYNYNQEILDKSQNNFNQDSSSLNWEFYQKDSQEYKQGLRVKIDCGENTIKFVTFHIKGDYFATVAPDAEKKNEQIMVHSISKATSQKPFNKSKGLMEKVLFHPTKPYLFLVTRKNTYIYNLQQQAQVKKLISGAQWNNCIAIHPKGDNIIVGSNDKRLCWFDLDLGATPYKTLKYHQRSIRSADFHNKYPLFASCSDDGTVHIFHATIFSDLMQNALIVPLKVLKGHKIKDDLGVLDIKFHPTQPWIFSAGADHNIIMWT